VSSDLLGSWRDTPTREAITDFVGRVTEEGGADYVAPADRIAVFDNDGTLWCEKPMPIELGFILERFAKMAQADPSLRDRQPWKAAVEQDYTWLGNVITKHYHGDETDVKVLLAGILQAFAGSTVEDYSTAASAYLHDHQHPTLGRPFHECGYTPMIDLLSYLRENGFTSYIASGGDRDFMRPVTEAIYGIPSEHVIGSSNALRYLDDEHGGTVAYAAEMDVLDDGPVKPVRIWSRIGRRPILAGGNSNGDIPMLRYAGGRSLPALRLLLLHDDAEREFDYTTGAEKSLERAAAEGWTVVSIRNDWETVFPTVEAS
jgi:phosphoglycolate phosphatase-like HAD superfamily hydrolase